MSADTSTWGRLLRERRTSLGWSLADLAARTGLSRAYISALERGNSKRPGAAAIQKLEDAVGPLIHRGDQPTDAPAGLTAFATEHGLHPADVAALANLKVRGRSPETKERWAFIYQALLASESIDDNNAPYQLSPTARRRAPHRD